MQADLPQFTTVLCDLDGTLVDSSQDITAAFQYALRLVSHGTLPAAHVITPHIGKPLAQMTLELGYRLSPAQLATFLDAYRRYYTTHSVRHTRPYPGVETTLRTLSTMTFGIVTTKLQKQAEVVLQHLRLAPFFRHIQGSARDLRLKPAPDMVVAALAALQCPPEQALMVGDTAADVQAGNAAGVHTCAVTYGFGRVEELQGCAPDYCIASFADLLAIVAA
jgi:phosphoglycolate phosphatase